MKVGDTITTRIGVITVDPADFHYRYDESTYLGPSWGDCHHVGRFEDGIWRDQLRHGKGDSAPLGCAIIDEEERL